MEPFKRSFAFFDVDETLLAFNGTVSFQTYYFLRYKARSSIFFLFFFLVVYVRYRYDLLRKKGQEYIHRRCYENFKGESLSNMEQAIEEWYGYIRQKHEHLFIERCVLALREHQRTGQEIVFVSGSFVELLRPLAEMLGVHYILATQMERVNGRYSGRVIPPQTVGIGKQKRIQAFLREHQCESTDCFAYGDHWSDIPMLEIVGHPCIILGDQRLEAYARKRDWSIL